jgi:hypothetical protein
VSWKSHPTRTVMSKLYPSVRCRDRALTDWSDSPFGSTDDVGRAQLHGESATTSKLSRTSADRPAVPAHRVSLIESDRGLGFPGDRPPRVQRTQRQADCGARLEPRGIWAAGTAVDRRAGTGAARHRGWPAATPALAQAMRIAGAPRWQRGRPPSRSRRRAARPGPQPRRPRWRGWARSPRVRPSPPGRRCTRPDLPAGRRCAPSRVGRRQRRGAALRR